MSERIPAVLLLGGVDLATDRRYLRAAAKRDLTVLVVDEPADLVGRWHGDDPVCAGDPAPVATGDDPAPAATAGLAATESTEIVDRAAAWARRYDIRGVCPLHERYVEAAALVADLFDLPSPGLRAARVCASGYLQSRYLAAWRPRCDTVAPSGRAEIVAGWTRYPATVAPVGRAAATGARLVRDAAELRAALGAYPPNQRLAIEEQPPGREYTIDSLSLRGELRRLDVTPRHAPPSRLDAEDRRRLTDTHAAILARLAFDTGPVHAGYRQVPGRPPTLTGIAIGHRCDAAASSLGGDGVVEDVAIGLIVGEDVARR